MTPEEKDFLIEEFKVNWTHLNSIEERRYKVFQYYSAFLGVSVGATFGLFRVASNFSLLAIVSISLVVCVFSIVCINILKHERKANERYRDRINSIRSIFLTDTDNVKISELIRPKSEQGYIETAPCPKKEFLVSEIFKPERHSTALLMYSFIVFGMCIGVFSAAFFLVYWAQM